MSRFIHQRRRHPATFSPSPPPDPDPDPPSGPTQTISYTVDTTTDIMNPERGWHKDANLVEVNGTPSMGSYAYVRNTHNMTLVRTYVRLDNFRQSDLSTGYLNNHRTALQNVRNSGVKLVLRYSYNFGSGGDATKARVLGHIAQLAPVWQEYADVISVLQGGFIGAWGEWHSSTNGLTTPQNYHDISLAILDALPDSRMMQARYPHAVVKAINGVGYSLGGWSSGNPPGGLVTAFNDALVTNAERFTNTTRARIGHKNDSFLRNHTDAGTYAFPENGHNWNTAHEGFLRDWLANSSRYTVHGGETVGDVPWTAGNRQSGPAAIAEMGRVSIDYLNRDYFTGVINGWIDSGHYAEITRRIGYRLGLLSATLPAQAAPGQSIGVSLTIRNDGFGKVYNPRPIDLVLVQGSTSRTIRLTSDARRDLPLGGDTETLNYTANLPGNIATGNHAMYLSLPAPEPSIQADPRYAIQLANTGGMWNGSTGRNNLGATVQIAQP